MPADIRAYLIEMNVDESSDRCIDIDLSIVVLFIRR